MAHTETSGRPMTRTSTSDVTIDSLDDRRGPKSLGAWCAERLYAALGPFPFRVQLWNGMVLAPPRGPACGTLKIGSAWTLLRILLRPGRCVGEAYRSGAIDVDGDLVGVLESVFRRWPEREDRPRSLRPSRFSTLRRARANARHHYDLGNDFYRLWLDDRMIYTCAYFPSPDLDLEQAQIAKMNHVCRKLRLQPGDRVLEAGCGWGALARHMAVHYGAYVTPCNVSPEQIRYARARAVQDGLGDRVRFIEDDFRNVGGTYDAFVSVGMLEHVGRRNQRDVGQVIHQRLDPRHGRGLLHFIGRNRPRALNPWIRRRIFPGAYPPTVGEVLVRVLEPWNFSVLDVENLRRHYELTLAHWRTRFERAADLVAAMFDDAFVRDWRLYLAGSQAAFATGWLQLFQVSFARAQHDDLPWSRAHLHPEERCGAV